MIKFANKTNCSPYSYILLLGSNALGNLVVHKPDSIEKSKRTREHCKEHQKNNRGNCKRIKNKGLSTRLARQWSRAVPPPNSGDLLIRKSNSHN